jgi:hypothetical protein
MKKILWMAPCLAPAIFFPGEKAPLDRLITNTKAYVEKNPSDAGSQYVLGRLYSRAFAEQTEAMINRNGKGPVPDLSLDSPDGPARNVKSGLKEKDREFATLSIRHYRRATELKPDESLYHFGLAWMLEQCSRFDAKLANPDSALDEYRKAYNLALPGDLKKMTIAPFETLIAEEAGKSMVEILKGRPSPKTQAEIAQIQRNVDTMSKRPRAITPVIFACNGNGELVSSSRVRFDLDGFGEGRKWTWVTSSACILVWDPDRTGRITSGRQLFGTVTWWMFWRNGYEPLAALDDNRDGKLSGTELAGIAVWRDANANGVSDPGEVVPVETWGITGIVVRGTDWIKGGIHFSDGRRVDSFDWVADGGLR